ncbi:gliding motility-associated C-terminal domain-containing protein [Flavobacteriaceae bacterium AU392]|nr:gliding motility-associated C-terminal domain-containing protein [Flavobacteriaceae bacterium]RKM81283.1 gliding motility-associated C-terminal domain-containing protein [Flavobacteriaceae bacterium AU392]
MKLKLYYFLVLVTFFITNINAQSSTCATIEPFCAGDSTLVFPNTSNGTSAEAGPNYGCLGTQPNPAWFFLQIDQAGTLNFQLEQNTNQDFTGAGLDVDFIAYGPFTNTDVCNNLTAANTVACSFSAAAIENFSINNAQAGEIYIVLITNFNGSPGFIRLGQTNANQADAGATDCSILNDVNACEGDIISLDATTNNAVRYEWTRDGVIIAETGPILNNVTAPNALYVSTAFNAMDDIILMNEFDVIFSEIPIANSVNDVLVCDDNNDDFSSFDLESFNAQILGTQDSTLFTITYHVSDIDANMGDNPINSPFINTTNPQTIYVRIENNANTNCFSITSFDIIIFDSPTANQPTPFALCDDDDDGDDTNGIGVTFDLTTKTNEVLGAQAAIDFNVTYYLTQADADAGIVGTEITTPVVNNVNPQTIYVRIENVLNTTCFETTTFDLEVNPLPTVVPIVDLRQCDDDTDGISLFNLTEANSLISTNANNENFTYYLTLADAEGGLAVDQINNFINYPNPTPLNSSVFVRIETLEGCFRTSQINLIVGATQIPTAFNLNFEECDNALIDGDNTNGVAAFDFSNATTQILNLFPVGQNLTVTYYENQADALAEINAIPDISNHRNDASPFIQNIYVRVDSDDINACLGLGQHITLTVNPLPLANPLTDFVLCSDDGINATFDLTTKDIEVIGTQTEALLISYHTSLDDAINNNAPIIGQYINTSNPQTIFVRSQFDNNGNGISDPDECFNTDINFQLIVNQNPILFAPDPIVICSDQTETTYDLTIRADQIIGGDTSIGLAYFESQQDLDNNNFIATPTTYLNTMLTRDVLVLATGTNGCFSTTTLSLETILFPDLNLTPDVIEECEVDNNGFDEFDITRRENEILNGLDRTDFIITYYESEADAIEGNSNNIQNITNFENTQAVTQTIYVRVIPVNTPCFRVIPLTLIVNPVPEIAIEDEYVLCLSPNNTSIPPVLTTFLPNPPIDTQLNSAEYTFEWFRGAVADPLNIITGEIGPTFTPDAIGQYTVVATDIVSGCTIPATTNVIGSFPPESITAEVITDAFSDNDIIEVTVIGNGEYEFSLDGITWQSSPRFENLEFGEYMVFVRDLLNCNSLVSNTVIIVDFPRFFTPNGDGTNDTWNIRGISEIPNSDIFIYDRYGKLLKQINPNGLGWDGTFNGEELPTNDYWFTIDFNEPSDGVRKQFKAHFTLKR